MIYIKPPSGDLLPKLPQGHILKLKKALYRLKQVGHQWYKTLSDILLSLNLVKSTYNNTVFYQYHKKKLILILFVHIDNITLCTRNAKVAEAFTQKLSKRVKLTNGGNIH